MKARAGFTAIELIMILTVLGVVAYITVPKFRVMVYQSREGQTKSNLSDIRGAVAIYYSDNFGRYPSDEGTPDTRLVTALVPLYMKRLPSVELSHLYPTKKNTVENRLDDQGDWVYSTLNGFVAVNSFQRDTKGEAISSW